MPHARRTSRTPAPGLLLLLLAALAPLLLSASPAHAADPAAGGARPRAATATGTEPLTVTMTSLSPAAIPAKGAISISGTVTNTSDEEWDDVNMSPFVSSTPITTRDDLALAAATESEATVGSRLTAPSTLQAVGDLRPGQSTTFALRIPVDLLGISGDPGVYWIGVHALGANAEGRDQVADGRARTFIPLLPRGRLQGDPTPVSIVLSLRDRVRRDAQGRVNGPSRWTDLTSARGRLTNLVDLAASAGTAPFSWVVDPAVLDALDDLSRGNPRLSLGGAQRRPEGEPSQSPDASPSASASPSPTPTASPGTRTDDATGSVDQATRDASARVLATFLGTAQGADLHTTGYADPDVVALARQRPGLLARADSLATRRLAARGLEAGRVVAPPDGYFDGQEVSELPRDTTLLLSDQGRERSTPTATRLPTGQDVVLTDARASSGGPSPMRRFDTLAVRQRVLSEAALEQMDPSLDGQPRPMVVQLPPRWDPGAAWRDADLFGTLTAAPWIRLTTLPGDASTTYDGRLAYGRTQRAQELGPANIDATRALSRTATVLGQLLDNDNDVSDTLTGAALSASSYFARDDRSNAAALVRDLDGTTRGRLDRVEVTVGDDFVTLSGGSGALTVTIVNGLAQPITVGLRATSDADVTIKVPEPVELGAGQRYTTRLPVSSRNGVHEVALQPVTADGLDAGTPTTFSLRTSQVGKLIWYIMAGGGLLLAVMIAKRIIQRLRHHQWRRDDGAAA